MTSPSWRTGRTQARGVDLEYRVWGDVSAPSPCLVWGHGLTSSMQREDGFGVLDWERLEDLTIGDDGRGVTGLVRYDARGHGLSGSTPDLVDYHWRALATDQLALADHLGIERYVAGGASMGSATALFASLLAPERITGLVLAIPPTAWETRAEQQGTYEAGARLVDAGELDVLVAGARDAPAPDPLVDVPEWRDRFERMVRETEPERLARVLRGAGITDLPMRDDIAGITVPTLILAWSGDPGHPVSTAERLHELIGDSTLHVATTADELASWTAHVADFLTELAA